MAYQVSAIAATIGITALTVFATYYKFVRHMETPDAPFPWLDMTCTLFLVAGGVFAMEMWARWAHKALWHDLPGGWALHKSHHEPRTGPFEVSKVHNHVIATY
jgi:beta-carotene 3-hydroxylase